MGHELRVRLYQGRLTGQYRWRALKGSRIVGASTQGYVDRGDRDDNLCTVMGGQLVTLPNGDVQLERPVFSPASGKVKLEEIPVKVID